MYICLFTLWPLSYQISSPSFPLWKFFYPFLVFYFSADLLDAHDSGAYQGISFRELDEKIDTALITVHNVLYKAGA